MGRIKKQRGPRDAKEPNYLGMVPAPEKVHWTPLEHPACGCVVDWGWDGKSVPPPAFIQWCRGVIRSACPWHGGEDGNALPYEQALAYVTVALRDPHSGASYYACMADDESVRLGVELTKQLVELDELVRKGNDAVLAAMPAKLRDWMTSRGHDPAVSWIEQRFTDIILNRGHVSVTEEMLARLKV
ncbi:hypothetical protein [Streptomyces sp. NPDC001205]